MGSYVDIPDTGLMLVRRAQRSFSIQPVLLTVVFAEMGLYQE